jgi:hypothetical protein
MTILSSCIKKRGQQSSFGLSFSMIFSIFLIIIFIITAFIVIGVFFDFDDSVSVAKFYTNFQDDVNSVWRSSSTPSFSHKIKLPKEITHVCFANLSAPITGSKEIYDQIKYYKYTDSNIFLIPPGAAKDLDINNITHLDIDLITSKQNPYCVPNPYTITLSKGVRSRLVNVD